MVCLIGNIKKVLNRNNFSTSTDKEIIDKNCVTFSCFYYVQALVSDLNEKKPITHVILFNEVMRKYEFP